METTMEMTTTKAKAPWIGVGKSGEWTSIEEAMDICGLNFHVEKYDPQFHYETKDNVSFYQDIPWVKATVREDTHEPLGVVSNTYQIVQNEDIFTMLQPFVDAGAKVTSGGMTEDGLCFMVLNMEQMEAGGDVYDMNIMATNSFNGKYPAAMICTPVRIICQNMYRGLMSSSDNVARFRHSLNIEGKLAAIKAAYEMFTDYKGEFGSYIDNLKKLPAAHTIDEVVEMMFPYTNTDVNSPRYESSTMRVDEKRAYYINRYYNSSTNSDQGTCFALVNAYYDYVSHDLPNNKTEEEYSGRRLSGLVGGMTVKPNLVQFMCESK